MSLRVPLAVLPLLPALAGCLSRPPPPNGDGGCEALVIARPPQAKVSAVRGAAVRDLGFAPVRVRVDGRLQFFRIEAEGYWTAMEEARCGTIEVELEPVRPTDRDEGASILDR